MNDSAKSTGDLTQSNKRLVMDFYRRVFAGQNPDAVKDFVA